MRSDIEALIKYYREQLDKVIKRFNRDGSIWEDGRAFEIELVIEDLENILRYHE